MLPPNLLIVSMVIFLATTVSMAPVEEKEQEEVEATEEGELSEEEEDDDDSQSQDRIEGLLGRQQTTTAAASGGSGAAAGVSSNIQDLSRPGAQAGGGQTQEGAAGSSAGSPGSAEAEAEHLSVPAGQPQPAGNGQKLLNGGGGGGGGGGQADTQTDFLGLFGGEDTHLEYTGTMDSSTHDFLLGLMGGGNRFGPEVHINVPVITSGVTAGPYSDQSSSFGLNSSVSTDPAPTDPGHHTDQARPGPTSLTLGPDLSQSSSFPGSSDSAVNGSSSSSHSEAHNEQTGNGPQTHLTDTNAATDRPVSFTELTASGGKLGHDVTESPIVLHTDSVNAFTDLVTVATDLTGTETVSDPTGSPLDHSLLAVTDYTQTAGSVTEQFNTSGQGPEGAENVELEDTC
ncbi:apomucin isoform X2 [Channa argus]|uniref:apomucin isoform X2 n=1 Tax=Channa argus TaxID=215402 RepID=UPI003522D5A4